MSIGNCPECNDDTRLVVREGKYGKFLGCPNYPDCTFTDSSDFRDEDTGEHDDWGNRDK